MQKETVISFPVVSAILKEACSILITEVPGKYILEIKQSLILGNHLAYLKHESKTR